MRFPAGCRLGSYEITARIGAGGMGEVYGARDRAAMVGKADTQTAADVLAMVGE